MNSTIVDSVILIAISSVTTMVFVQLFKTVLNSILIGKFDAKTLFSDGDFPSSHTAILVSFNIVFWYIIYAYSTNNPDVDMFASVLVGLVLALWSCYVMRDAMGVRLRVQEQAYAIRQIALSSKDLSDKIDQLFLSDYPVNSIALGEEIDDLLSNLKLKAGHFPHEVLGGIVTGGIIGCMFISAVSNNFRLLTTLIVIFIGYIGITVLMFVNKKKKNSSN